MYLNVMAFVGAVIPQGRSFLSSQPSVLQWGGHIKNAMQKQRELQDFLQGPNRPWALCSPWESPHRQGVSANSSTAPTAPRFSSANGEALGRGGTTSDMRLKVFPFLVFSKSLSAQALQLQKPNRTVSCETADGVQE